MTRASSEVNMTKYLRQVARKARASKATIDIRQEAGSLEYLCVYAGAVLIGMVLPSEVAALRSVLS
jgi:hypothetical protein